MPKIILLQKCLTGNWNQRKSLPLKTKATLWPDFDDWKKCSKKGQIDQGTFTYQRSASDWAWALCTLTIQRTHRRTYQPLGPNNRIIPLFIRIPRRSEITPSDWCTFFDVCEQWQYISLVLGNWRLVLFCLTLGNFMHHRIALQGRDKLCRIMSCF